MKMDPAGSWEVTIDGLIATIGTTSHRVTNFIRAVRAARADLVHVTRELSDLRLELELLRDEHNVPPHIQARSLAVLDSCGVVLRRIASLLGGDSPSSPSSSPKPDPSRAPQRWSVKERFATSNLCNCLQTYREALTLLPDVASLYVPCLYSSHCRRPAFVALHLRPIPRPTRVSFPLLAGARADLQLEGDRQRTGLSPTLQMLIRSTLRTSQPASWKLSKTYEKQYRKRNQPFQSLDRCWNCISAKWPTTPKPSATT